MQNAGGRIAEERSVVIAGPASDGEIASLDGLYRAGASPAAGAVLIAPPHPLYGGSMESPVVTEIAFAAARAGLASLRFDWRGVGASGGTPSGEPRDHDADYLAALQHLADTHPGSLCAAGYSAGAAAAARVAMRAPRVTSLLLVAPPTAMLDAAALEAFRGRVLLVAAEHDRIAPPDALRALAERLVAARFECAAEADHFFGTGLAALGRAAAAWLAAEDSDEVG